MHLIMSPSVLKVVAKPGTTPHLSFKLENKGDPALVTIQILPFTPIGNNGQVVVGKKLDATIPFQPESSSIIFGTPFLLKSNSPQDISIQMSLPSQLSEKDYYFTVLASTTPFPESEGSTALQFSTRIGSFVLLSVTSNGAVEQRLSIPLLSVPRSTIPLLSSVYESSTAIPLVFMAKNNGRNFVTTQGSVTISGWNQKQKYNLQEATVLSGTQRLLIDGSTCKSDCSKTYSLILKGFFIGKYTVTASVSSQRGERAVTAQTTFVAFPFKLIGLLFLMALAFLWLRKNLVKE